VTFVHAWVAYPLLVLALSLGIGLLLRRIAGPRALPGVLVLPVGFAGIVAISVFPTQLDATAELTGPAILATAVLGLILARKEVRNILRPSRAWSWPALAAVLPAGSIAAPIVLTGQPGVTGYARIVDIAHQLELTSWLTSMGRVVPVESTVDSSYLSTVFKLTNVGYPGGSQAALGGTSDLIGIDPLWSYQVFLALVAGVLGVALYALLARAIPAAPWRAVAAGVAAQPTILYSYGLVGGIKELSAIAAITLAAAVLIAHRPSQGGSRHLLPAAVALAAGFAVFNLGILPWIGILAGVVFAVDLVKRRGRLRTIDRWATLGLFTIVLSIPTILIAVKLAPVAAGGGPVDLGNLAAPVPGWAAVGPWLTDDYRFPLADGGQATATYVLIGAMLVLAVLGLVRALRVRDLRLIALSAAGAVALVFVTRRAGPWVDLKAYAITAPITVALAFAGAATLTRHRRIRWLGVVAGAVTAVAVLGGNALVYHTTAISPYERFADLKRLGEKYAGQGPTILPVFEEFGEYLLRDAVATGPVNPPQGAFFLSAAARPGMQFVRDPDELNTDWLNEHRLLIVRRDPTASRPPSNWSLVERGRFYDVWRRRAAAPRVIAHVPLQARRDERGPDFCRRLGRQLADAGAGARLTYAVPSAVVQYAAPEGSGPVAWTQIGPDFIAKGPGRLEGSVRLPVAAEYTVWMRASVGRRVRVLVDQKPVGAIRWQQSYPGQYEQIGKVRLSAGEHGFQVVRGGGSLLPGTGDGIDGSGSTRRIGPVAFVPAGAAARLHTVSAAQAAVVCRSDLPLDWIEIVKPRG